MITTLYAISVPVFTTVIIYIIISPGAAIAGPVFVITITGSIMVVMAMSDSVGSTIAAALS